MDFAELAKQVMDILTPMLPFLASAGTVAGTAVGTELSKDVYNQGKHLYTVVHEHFDQAGDDGKASRALQSVAEDPDNRDTVEIKLTRMLAADPSFASELQQIVQSYRQSINIGVEAEASDVSMSNESGKGVQEIQGGDRSKFQRIKMNMKNPSE